VSEFLLLAARPAIPGELSPARAARDLAALAAWQGCLRRWGLLASFAVGRPGHGPAACLVVRVSGPAAAWRLAAGWQRLAGYDDVTVLPLAGVAGRGQAQ
jgi:hypothetical protein